MSPQNNSKQAKKTIVRPLLNTQQKINKFQQIQPQIRNINPEISPNNHFSLLLKPKEDSCVKERNHKNSSKMIKNNFRQLQLISIC